MSNLYVDLTLDIQDTNGVVPQRGTVTFTPSVVLTDTTDHAWIPPSPVVVELNGRIPVANLLACDSPNPAPAGWGWTISFANVFGMQLDSFTFFLNHADGAEQFLSDQSPVSDVTTMQAYLPLPTGTPTAGQVPEATGSGQNSAWATPAGPFLCTPVSYAPASQTSLTVSTTTMAAFDSVNVNTGSFTAPASGKVLVTASFVMQQSASAGGAFGLAAHGTVTPIVAPEWIFRDSAGTIPRSVSVQFLVTGLTAGNSCNFDLVGCMTSSDTMTILALGVTSTTPTLTLGASGGPVVMTVQAV